MSLQFITHLFLPPHTGNAFVKYTTSYSLKTLDDGQVYLVLQNYHLDIDPEKITVELGNLFDGNKVLGKLQVSILQNTTTGTNGY